MPHDADSGAPNKRCAVPTKIQKCLIEIFGESANDVTIIIDRRKLAWHFWPGIAGATTRRGKIFINFPCGQFWNDPKFVLHEYYHVIQQWGVERMSVWGYLARFWIREREARRFAEQNLHRLQQCMSHADYPETLISQHGVGRPV